MRDIDHVQLLSGQALTLAGNPTNLGQNFPMGRGWYATRLRFKFVVTETLATGPIAGGAIGIIKSIFIKTDKNEILCNCNGKALQLLNQKEYGTMPQVDTVVDGGGTFYVNLTIPHARWKRGKGVDTILDTARYKSISLQITLGTVADLFTTVGDAAVVASMDAEAIVSMGILPAKAQPLLYRSFYTLPPVLAAAGFVEVDRARDLAISNIITHQGYSAGGAGLVAHSAGVAFTGDGVNSIVNDFDLKDQDKFYTQSRILEFAQSDNKDDWSLEAIQTGICHVPIDRDGSVFASLYTGNKSQLRFQYRTKAGFPAGQISVALDAVRQLVR